MKTGTSLKERKSLIVICACLAALIPALDHLSKYLVRTTMTPGKSVSVIGEFFRVTYVLNDGMAFGALGGGWRWVFMILTPITLALVAFLFFRYFKKLHPFTAASFVMIFAGGLSNMVDRVFFYHLDPSSKGLFDGRVVDFLDFNITVFGRRIWSAVFNIADAFVVVGVFLLLIMIIVIDVRQRKAQKAGQTAKEAEGTGAARDRERAACTVYPAEESADSSTGAAASDEPGAKSACAAGAVIAGSAEEKKKTDAAEETDMSAEGVDLPEEDGGIPAESGIPAEDGMPEEGCGTDAAGETGDGGDAGDGE